MLPALNLKWDFAFEDLYRREGLVRLDAVFLDHLKSADVALFNRLMEARAAAPDRKIQSALIIDLAPHLEDFLGDLFGIAADLRTLQSRHSALEPLFALKRKFIQKKAASGITAEQAAAINGPALAAELESLFNGPLTEDAFVEHVSRWLENESEHAAQLAKAQQYAAWAALSPAGRAKHHGGILFHLPHKLDPLHLVPVETVVIDGIARLAFPAGKLRHREGFELTDPGMDLACALDQAHYCIKCHNQSKDSCSTGLREKSGDFK